MAHTLLLYMLSFDRVTCHNLSRCQVFSFAFFPIDQGRCALSSVSVDIIIMYTYLCALWLSV